MAQFCSVCGKSARDSAKFCQGCGAPFVQVLQTGMKLDRDRYEVLKPLKSGGMGAVYLLHDNWLERKCVLKEMVPPSQDPVELKEFRERFRNEALTLSKLSHPNLPPVYDHFEENHQCCLVMEYIEGDDLESLLAKQSPGGFPEEQVRQWALTICTILEYLHSQKPLILYRDLKPSNTMLRKRDERLFLIDFGLAKSVHQALTHKTPWGTEGYAPIEQCQGEPEVRSDLYALGATMHHLLSGRPPVPFKFQAIRLLRPDVSSEMEAVLEGVGQSAKATHPAASLLPQSSPATVQPNAAPAIQATPTQPPYKSIFEAVNNNDLTAVKDFISSGTDVNIQQSDWDKTPLHCAAEKGYRDIVEYLIAKGAEVNATEFYGMTPLQQAAMEGHKEVAELLISKGADIEALGDKDMTPLQWAAMYGRKEVVELLLSRGADIYAVNDGNVTMLHCAAVGGLRDFAELLIAKGSDVNATADYDQKEGITPLHEAAEYGHKEVVELLIAKGAEVNATEFYGMTPLQQAAMEGHKEVVELLITKGADVNASDEDGIAPLHSAALNGYKEVAELLISKGADVDATDEDCWTPLHKAAMRDHKEVAELLISKGADIEATGEDDLTPFHLAVFNGHKEVVEFFILKGSDVNATDEHGRSPLHLALEIGRKEMVEFLIAKGADVNVADYDEKTPLHCAIEGYLEEIAALLIANGADVNAADGEGKTPLHLASEKGHTYFCELLLDHGADINARDNEGRTPRDLAKVFSEEFPYRAKGSASGE